MTLEELKQVYHAIRAKGLDKETAFNMIQRLTNDAHSKRINEIERFRYEINAIEQRRGNGDASK